MFQRIAQWIGPNLETLELARRQIEIELNSTTDNPLLDVENSRIAHGGNFQAVSHGFFVFGCCIFHLISDCLIYSG